MRALSHVRVPALALALSAIVLVTACGDDDSNNPNPVNAGDVLGALPGNVIMPTYEDLAAQANDFTNAILTFTATPNDLNLAAARQAWRDVRTPWESAEAFGFGPADVGGFDEQSDSWPVNTTDIDNLLSTGGTLAKTDIDALADPGLKGFHAIEYVLFGGSQNAAGFTARDLEYLNGASQALEGQADGLLAAWDPANGDYSGQLANAGSGGSVYITQEAAIDEIISGMADIADELANEKMAGVLGPPADLTLEESRFSGNSADEFTHNIQGVANVYLGNYGSAHGVGITDLVKAKDPTLDTNVRAALTAAEAAITLLAPDFANAVTNNATLVQDAIDAVNVVRDLLDQDVRQLLVQ